MVLNLICIACTQQFQAKSKLAKYCSCCRMLEDRRQAREYKRARGLKHEIKSEITCLKCNCKIDTIRINREYCDVCRRVRLNELRRKRRAQHPEKYRIKDLSYNRRTRGTIVTVANRRAKQYGKSVINLEIMNSIFKIDNYTCQYCYKRGGVLTMDHVVPLCSGGSNDDSNLVTACRTCNMSKGKKPLLEFLLFINQASERN